MECPTSLNEVSGGGDRAHEFHRFCKGLLHLINLSQSPVVEP